MVQTHKCKEKDADQMIENYLLDGSDPFNPHKKLKYYQEEKFDVEDQIKKLNDKVNAYIKSVKENPLLYNKSKRVEQKNESFNSKNYKGNIGKPNKDYISQEIEVDGMTVIRQKPKKPEVKEKNYTQPKPLNVVPSKPTLEISDYPSFFSQFYNELKSFITNKIKEEKINETEVIIPVIVGYQLIVIISKLDLNEMAELKFLTNFGFGFSMVEEILHCFSNSPKYYLTTTIKQLPFNKLLILYKYLHICYLKSTGAYYKRDEDQIEEDIYDDFIPREKKKEKVQSGINYCLNAPKDKHYIGSKKKVKQKIINPDIIKQDSIKANNENQKTTFQNAGNVYIEQEKEKKLKGLFNDSGKDKKSEDYFGIENNFQGNPNKSKSKLGQLLSSHQQATAEPQIIIKSTNNKKKFKVNEEEFPELK